MPTSESRASSPCRTLRTLGGSRVEIGLCFHGFCDGSIENKSKNNAIWVIVGRLTKFADFIAMASTWTLDQLVRAYLNEIIAYMGCIAYMGWCLIET